jgi:hypothetical protein
LFTLACGVWLASAIILFVHRAEVIATINATLAFVRDRRMIAR